MSGCRGRLVLRLAKTESFAQFVLDGILDLLSGQAACHRAVLHIVLERLEWPVNLDRDGETLQRRQILGILPPRSIDHRRLGQVVHRPRRNVNRARAAQAHEGGLGVKVGGSGYAVPDLRTDLHLGEIGLVFLARFLDFRFVERQRRLGFAKRLG